MCIPTRTRVCDFCVASHSRTLRSKRPKRTKRTTKFQLARIEWFANYAQLRRLRMANTRA